MEKNKVIEQGSNQLAKQVKKFPGAAKGVEVAPGTNWVTGLTHQQRTEALRAQENKWKAPYNSSRGTLSFDRG